MPVRAGLLRTAAIVLRSVYVTLAITIPTLWDVRRGHTRRDVGDVRLRWWARRLLEIVELHCRVFNLHAVEPRKGRPTIIMSNHSSLYDIPLIFVAISGSIRMLTKRELFRVPIWGRGLKAGEFLSIDRRNRRRAIADLDRARDKMTSGIIVWIAPEGTRSRTGALGPFKKGGFMLALRTGATIIPVGIRGARDVLPARTLRFRLGCRAEIHIGRPVDASRYDRRTCAELMREVETSIRELAGLHVPGPSGEAYGDGR